MEISQEDKGAVGQGGAMAGEKGKRRKEKQERVLGVSKNRAAKSPVPRVDSSVALQSLPAVLSMRQSIFLSAESDFTKIPPFMPFHCPHCLHL